MLSDCLWCPLNTPLCHLSLQFDFLSQNGSVIGLMSAQAFVAR